MKEIDPETLARADGKEGRPVYICYKGRVIDVTKSRLWQTGVHMGRHAAGADLTVEIAAAPHGTEVLDRYAQVGELQPTRMPAQPQSPALEEPHPESLIPAFLDKFLSRYPLFRRHPHPSTVHFPIAFMAAASGFCVLHLVTGRSSFEVTSLHCLAAGILTALLAMGTGLFSWWVNYMARPVRQVTIKIVLSCIMLADAAGVLIWRFSDPGVLSLFRLYGAIYLIMILALGPLSLAIGYFGGTLTFPLEKVESKRSS